MPQFWLFQILIGLSMSSVTLLIFSWTELCYKQMLRASASSLLNLKAVERTNPVHDKDLLAMKYALVKFKIHLLGSKPFVVYTDHASLSTVTQSPHL